MLTVFGSLALDTIRTPKKTVSDTLGGAAAYAAVSAGHFTRTGLVGAAGGDDITAAHKRMLGRYASLDGLAVIRPGKMFRYDGIYDDTFSTRTTLNTELNVLADFEPSLPDGYRASQFVYLANNDPDQNIALLKEFDSVRFSMCDTIDFWIAKKRPSVIRMIKSVDALAINDEEARLLTGEHCLLRCAKKITQECGVPYIIIKKGEHGSLLFHQDEIVSAPAYPVEQVTDPTGAGDSFAGAVMGHLAGRRQKKVTFDQLKKSMMYGNVMGSFAVQGYGLGGLLRIRDDGEICRRVEAYRRILL